MKENRKLIKEVLKEVRHDMTDEEVLELLAQKQGVGKPRKPKIYGGTARGGRHCTVCRQLGVYILLYRGAYPVDDGEHPYGVRGI